MAATSNNKTTNMTDWWRDKKLIKQVRQADADMASGKDKGVLWSEAKQQLLQRGKK